jgi:hypothetical protein
MGETKYIFEKLNSMTHKANPFWTRIFDSMDDVVEFINVNKGFLVSRPYDGSNPGEYFMVRCAVAEEIGKREGEQKCLK